MDNYGLVASPGEANHSGVGIGVGLRADAAGVHVNRVFHGGPAHLCGRVAVGDVLEEVGGLPVRGVNEAESALAGPLGSLVDVRIRHALSGDSVCLQLLRQDVDVDDRSPVDAAVGIGAALRVERSGVVVDKVLPGGAAFLAALPEGGLITKIDGTAVNTGHFHQNEISDMLRGEEGSRVALEFVPAYQGGRIDRTEVAFADLVRMHPVDVGALMRYRQAIAVRRAQHGLANAQGDYRQASAENSDWVGAITPTGVAAGRRARQGEDGAWSPAHGESASGSKAADIMLAAADLFLQRLDEQERRMMHRYDVLDSELEVLASSIQGLSALDPAGVRG